MKKLHHFGHAHPLVLVKEEIDWISIIYYCSACKERVEGSSYNCTECDFCLHKSFAELPREINHPFHTSHPLILYDERQYAAISVGFRCDSRRKEKGKEFVYHCSSCKFDLDIRCALLPNLITGDFSKLKHFSHQHSLFFIQNHYIEPLYQSCFACEEPISGPIYFCFDCNFFLHKKCFDLPLEIKHPSHYKHPLTLLANPPPHHEKCCCWLCSKPCKGFVYYCSPCEFGIKAKYAFSDDVIKSKNHEHPFTLLLRPISFICDACGSDGEYCIPYVCTACNLAVHRECISLPRNILITSHDHPISHIYYFLEEKEVRKRDSRICENEINAEYGCYHCLSCEYFVHVDFAMDKYIFIQERSISTSFYYCAECNYILHKRCAELPRKTEHWAFKQTFTLEPYIHARCGFCCFYGSGLFYINDVNGWKYCISCFLIPDTVTTQGHRHQLFFDHKITLKCSICDDGRVKYGAFVCRRRECNQFTLDCTHLVLPNTARCKYDNHPLLGLTYKYDFHEHPLSFAKEDYYHNYPKCNLCGEYCEDVFFKCTQLGCKYVIDWDCRLHLGT
ncbi:hypothetical protein SLA2020_236830 [Shorea laevis]